MLVVIAGAHGKIARLLTPLLSEAGHGVRGIIRNPDHADDLRADGAAPVVCDLESAGAGPGSGADRKWTVDRDAAVKLVEAARGAGARRYVIVSSVGAEDPPGGDEVFAVYLRAKAEADQAVMASDLDWTVVRPGGLTDDDPTGKVRLDEEPYRGQVPRADVAAVLAAVLADDRALRRVLYCNGGEATISEALDALS
jgi:uncharacterized protein YbjT (DUF2867 family)